MYIATYIIIQVFKHIPYMSTVQLLGPMDKYKKAEVVYGYVDLVFVIIGLFSKIIGGRDCERKMVNKR